MGEEERGLRCAPMNRHDAPVSEISLPFKITKFHTALPIDFGFEVSSYFVNRFTQIYTTYQDGFVWLCIE